MLNACLTLIILISTKTSFHHNQPTTFLRGEKENLLFEILLIICCEHDEEEWNKFRVKKHNMTGYIVKIKNLIVCEPAIWRFSFLK